MIQNSFSKEDGPFLYIVSTPIGNLKDITFRAIEILGEVDFIYAEDTRITKKLLNYYKINTNYRSYYEHNEEIKEKEIIELLKEGKKVALVSDAGTPGISDPGYKIIVSAIACGFNVVSIPGASAMLAALVSSGLVIQPFTFLGFLPRKDSKAKEALLDYQNRKETLVIYESLLRVDKTLKLIYDSLGNRRVSLAREITKKFETITRAMLIDIIDVEQNKKGEYVIIIEGSSSDNVKNDSEIEAYDRYISQGFTKNDAIKKTAKDFNVSKNVIYQMIIDQKNK